MYYSCCTRLLLHFGYSFLILLYPVNKIRSGEGPLGVHRGLLISYPPGAKLGGRTAEPGFRGASTGFEAVPNHEFQNFFIPKTLKPLPGFSAG